MNQNDENQLPNKPQDESTVTEGKSVENHVSESISEEASISVVEPKVATAIDSAKPRYAGFWIRTAATMLDFLIVGIFASIITGAGFFLGFWTLIMSAEGMQANDDVTTVLALILYFAAIGFYFFLYYLYKALMECSRAKGTLGKLIVGIIVTDLDGQRIKFGKSSFRFLMYFLGFIMTNNAIAIMVAFTEKKQGLHDMAAKTLVVHKYKD